VHIVVAAERLVRELGAERAGRTANISDRLVSSSLFVQSLCLPFLAIDIKLLNLLVKFLGHAVRLIVVVLTETLCMHLDVHCRIIENNGWRVGSHRYSLVWAVIDDVWDIHVSQCVVVVVYRCMSRHAPARRGAGP
jgi:hypothetical protein